MSFVFPAEPLPDTSVERAQMFEQTMVASCAGGERDEDTYRRLRQAFIDDEELRALLPEFVRTSRSLSTFWSFISPNTSTYAERRKTIAEAFSPLFDFVEGRHPAPSDSLVGSVLQSFDPDAVHVIWAKALSRRHEDPEGAITVARTLLETVCKTILDRHSSPYDDSFDLPKLYGAVSRLLQLSPNQHTEEAFKAILGGVHTVVNGLGRCATGSATLTAEAAGP